MNQDNRHSVSVAGVVLDDEGRALLIQRRDNACWEAPGGILECDESICAGLQREMLEETGLRVEPGLLTGVYKNMARGIIALVFRCYITGGQLGVTAESQAFRWVTPEEIKSLASEAFAIRVLDAMADRPSPAIRHHDGTRLLNGECGQLC